MVRQVASIIPSFETPTESNEGGDEDLHKGLVLESMDQDKSLRLKDLELAASGSKIESDVLLSCSSSSLSFSPSPSSFVSAFTSFQGPSGVQTGESTFDLDNDTEFLHYLNDQFTSDDFLRVQSQFLASQPTTPRQVGEDDHGHLPPHYNIMPSSGAFSLSTSSSPMTAPLSQRRQVERGTPRLSSAAARLMFEEYKNRASNTATPSSSLRNKVALASSGLNTEKTFGTMTTPVNVAGPMKASSLAVSFSLTRVEAENTSDTTTNNHVEAESASGTTTNNHVETENTSNTTSSQTVSETPLSLVPESQDVDEQLLTVSTVESHFDDHVSHPILTPDLAIVEEDPCLVTLIHEDVNVPVPLPVLISSPVHSCPELPVAPLDTEIVETPVVMPLPLPDYLVALPLEPHSSSVPNESSPIESTLSPSSSPLLLPSEIATSSVKSSTATSVKPRPLPKTIPKRLDHTIAKRTKPIPGSSVAKSKEKKSVTVPKPFSFHTTNRSKNSATRSELAPSILEAEKSATEPIASSSRLTMATTSASASMPPLPSSSSSKSQIYVLIDNRHKMTTPMSPLFLTKHRAASKSQPLLSTEEMELRKMSDLPMFKAKPVNLKVLQSAGDLGIPKIEKLKPTTPKAFHFQSDRVKRAFLDEGDGEAELLEQSEEKRESDHRFVARPAPKSILDHVVGVPPKQEKPTTVPMSPPIRKAKGTKPAYNESDAVGEESLPFRAQPIPRSLAAPFQPVLSHKATVPEPFMLPGSLMTHSTKSRFMEQVAEALEVEKKAREFRARPSGVHLMPRLPAIPERPLTEPRPFKLFTERFRRQLNSRKSVTDVSDSEDVSQPHRKSTRSSSHSDVETCFRARPMPKSAPFIPKKSTKPLTQLSGHALNTERRAAERSTFDQTLSHKEVEAAKRREQEQASAAALAEQEIKEYRKRLVHTAQPIRQYKLLSTQSFPAAAVASSSSLNKPLTGLKVSTEPPVDENNIPTSINLNSTLNAQDNPFY